MKSRVLCALLAIVGLAGIYYNIEYAGWFIFVGLAGVAFSNDTN